MVSYDESDTRVILFYTNILGMAGRQEEGAQTGDELQEMAGFSGMELSNNDASLAGCRCYCWIEGFAVIALVVLLL